jgi:hypothetical protein
MFVCCECCVLLGRGLCDELITHPEESYRPWCVVVCDLETLKNEEVMTRVGSQRHRKRKKCNSIMYTLYKCFSLHFNTFVAILAVKLTFLNFYFWKT